MAQKKRKHKFLPYAGSFHWSLSYLGVTCKEFHAASKVKQKAAKHTLKAVYKLFA